MFDRQVSQWIKPAIDRGAAALLALGLTANQATYIGFGLGLLAAGSIATQHYGIAAVLIVLSRLFDGLDGALARLTVPTDQGGFLDIALDFLFYASIPLAFAIANPTAHALPAATLLAAFIGTGSSFLAFAVLAAKRKLTSTAYPAKSFYFLGGLTEATETLGFFLAMCIWPHQFAVLAYSFAALCTVTIAMRIWWGYQTFAD